MTDDNEMTLCYMSDLKKTEERIDEQNKKIGELVEKLGDLVNVYSRVDLKTYQVGDIKTTSLRPDTFFKLHSKEQWAYMDGKTSIPKTSEFYKLTSIEIAPNAMNLFFKYNTNKFGDVHGYKTGIPKNKSSDKCELKGIARDRFTMHPTLLKGYGIFHLGVISSTQDDKQKIKAEGHIPSATGCDPSKKCYEVITEDIPLSHSHEFSVNGNDLFKNFDDETEPANISVFAYLKIN